MYQPNTFDLSRLRERASQFENQLKRHKEGVTTPEEFRPLRLQNGLYIQRHAPMLRIAIAYGMLNTRQLKSLAQITTKYDRGYGHLTTRQNMQLNWIKVDDVPKALKELAEVGLHGIQSSGNCLRNITSDALAGICKGEIVDPRPYAEILRQWSTFHPELSFLPRKFKVAFTGAVEDRALIQVHDLAFEAIAPEPEVRFRVRAGGGLGRTPVLGPVIHDSLHWTDITRYTHALMRLYNRLGRRDNLTKARIKILIRSVGTDEFKKLLDEEFTDVKQNFKQLDLSDLDRVKNQFLEEREIVKKVSDSGKINQGVIEKTIDSVDFINWKNRCVINHKYPGLSIVKVPVKGEGRAPGDVTAEEMLSLCKIADEFSASLVRVTHAQNFVLPYVSNSVLPDLYLKLQELSMARPVSGLLTDMVCCPGGDFCSLANARSITVAEDINRRYKSLDKLESLGNIDLRISGCMNSCGHHHIGNIGILGVDKDGKAFYQLLLGGNSGEKGKASLGKIIAKAFAEDEISDAVENILQHYLSKRDKNETFQNTVARLGNASFAEAANKARKS